MQNPSPDPKPVQFPAKSENRHEFTDAQLEVVTAYHQKLTNLERQVQDVREFLGMFVGYVQKEAQLDSTMTWSLTGDPKTGKPYLAGAQSGK